MLTDILGVYQKVRFETGCQNIAQLADGNSADGYLAKERVGYDAILADQYLLKAEIGFAVDVNTNAVARVQWVAAIGQCLAADPGQYCQ